LVNKTLAQAKELFNNMAQNNQQCGTRETNLGGSMSLVEVHL